MILNSTLLLNDNLLSGASPATSIKHAGSPWELGLVESHSTLLNNGLRDRVLLRVDGGLKSGWDVVMAAAMGCVIDRCFVFPLLWLLNTVRKSLALEPSH